MKKTARSKSSGVALASAAATREIRPEVLYPLATAMAMLGIGKAGLRAMRARGLEVRYVASKGFILGAEIIRVVTTLGKTEKNQPATLAS